MPYGVTVTASVLSSAILYLVLAAFLLQGLVLLGGLLSFGQKLFRQVLDQPHNAHDPFVADAKLHELVVDDQTA